MGNISKIRINAFTFGTILDGRTFGISSRYGFNGKEKDDEIFGNGDSYDYGARIFDSRIARFLTIDLLAGEFPYYSPYQFASNSPIIAIDIDGTESSVQLNNTEIVDTKAEAQAIVASKYGRNGLERTNPSAYFTNRQNEAIGQSKAVLNVVNDGLIITGGVVACILTAGAAAPIAATIVGTLSGTMAVAGGTAKLVADVTGNSEASDKIPTSYFGGMSLMIELSLGDKKHLVSGTVSLVEGVYTWNPTDVQELNKTLEAAGYGLDAINNIISGVQLSQQIVDEFAPKENEKTSKSSKSPDATPSNKLSNKEVKKIKSFVDKLSKSNASSTKAPKQKK